MRFRVLSDYSDEFEIKSDPSQIHTVEKKLERFCAKLRLVKDDIENLGIATTEIVNNAIRHGNQSDPEKTVHIKFEKKAKSVRVTVSDSGKGFEPDSLANPLEPENIYKESGRGIFIVKMLMDDVKFKFTDTGSQVILIKKL